MNFIGATTFAFWADLYIVNGTSQGLYYAIQGNAPNRTIVFEYYASRTLQYCHFQVLFFESKPGVVQFIYLDVPDGNLSATVGVQGKCFIQISVSLST